VTGGGVAAAVLHASTGQTTFADTSTAANATLIVTASDSHSALRQSAEATARRSFIRALALSLQFLVLFSFGRK